MEKQPPKKTIKGQDNINYYKYHCERYQQHITKLQDNIEKRIIEQTMDLKLKVNILKNEKRCLEQKIKGRDMQIQQLKLRLQKSMKENKKKTSIKKNNKIRHKQRKRHKFKTTKKRNRTKRISSDEMELDHDYNPYEIEERSLEEVENSEDREYIATPDECDRIHREGDADYDPTQDVNTEEDSMIVE